MPDTTATSSNAAVSHADQQPEPVVCSTCGSTDGPFSNRQLNKAAFGEAARCKKCIKNCNKAESSVGKRAAVLLVAELEEDSQKYRKRADEFEDDSKKYKRSKTLISAAAQELICPITKELPVDPVTAMDGRVYERREIERLIEIQGFGLRSPMTNEPMMTNPSRANLRIINWINTKKVDEAKTKAEAGDIAAICNLGDWHLRGENGLPENEDQALRWYKKAAELGIARGEAMAKKIQQTKFVKHIKAMAEAGSAESMYNLGLWYYNGLEGLSQDVEQAYKWFKKAADVQDVEGMAMAGWCLLMGHGVEKKMCEGMVLLVSAAKDGSDYACYKLGMSYYKGSYGITKNRDHATYWLSKVVDGSCSVKSLYSDGVTQAQRALESLRNS